MTFWPFFKTPPCFLLTCMESSCGTTCSFGVSCRGLGVEGAEEGVVGAGVSGAGSVDGVAGVGGAVASLSGCLNLKRFRGKSCVPAVVSCPQSSSR